MAIGISAFENNGKLAAPIYDSTEGSEKKKIKKERQVFYK